MDSSMLLFIFGMMIVIITLILQLRKRHNNEFERKKKNYEAILAANQKKVEELVQKGEDPKRKLGEPEMSRIHINDPFRNNFSGSVAQNQIAKWETEMFALGRQLVGQIDSKIVVIETLTLEANRTANRLELLIEHFEQLANKLENNGKNKTIDQPTPPNTTNTQNIHNTQHTKYQNTQTNTPTIVPAAPTSEQLKTGNEIIEQKIEIQTTNFTDYLNELTTEIDGLQSKVDGLGGAKEVTILRATQTQKLPDNPDTKITHEITTPEIKSDTIEPTIKITNPFALTSPRLPAGGGAIESIQQNVHQNIRSNISSSIRLNNTADNNKNNDTTDQTARLSIDALFGESANRDTINNSNQLDRKQIEMLANYGFNSKEIAQKLNVSTREVDAILNSKK
ncbi:MAG: hypothetical protein LBJ00_07090 [Planctomycetaceae bacterium]|jgi:hypothetical protein|nr:hypothetical protein [Planctomycetaceae bacterium]